MNYPIIQVTNVNKTYASGFQALKDVSLTIQKGEILALLGPNGAGKTTLINIICGIVNATSGSILVDQQDIFKNYRQARSRIGLVPQEISTDMFEKVIDTVNFSRNLFGKKKNPVFIEKLLRDLTLWDKKDSKIMTLSGGMKRRVMIAKALSHEPDILFLDEPTAGVDVELRKEMWKMVRNLRKGQVTIILTTHYIEEAQEMADRIGIMNKGKIILIEEKDLLMKTLGKRQLILTLRGELHHDISDLPLEVSSDRTQLTYTFDSTSQDNGISVLMKKLEEKSIEYRDLQTVESSLEEIFVNLVGERS